MNTINKLTLNIKPAMVNQQPFIFITIQKLDKEQVSHQFELNAILSPVTKRMELMLNSSFLADINGLQSQDGK